MASSFQPMLPIDDLPIKEAKTRSVPGLTNKYRSRCTDCGRDLPPGYATISRPNPKQKWQAVCRNGCQDIEGIHTK